MSVLVKVGPAETDAAQDVATAIDFAVPPPGMMGLRSFTLTPLDEAGYLFAMRSTEQPDVRLFVVAPQPYFPTYAPRVDAGTRAALGLAEEPVLLVVVNPGAEGDVPTANLLAPVAVNPVTGQAVQVVLDGDEWPLRAPFGIAA